MGHPRKEVKKKKMLTRRQTEVPSGVKKTTKGSWGQGWRSQGGEKEKEVCSPKQPLMPVYSRQGEGVENTGHCGIRRRKKSRSIFVGEQEGHQERERKKTPIEIKTGGSDRRS